MRLSLLALLALLVPVVEVQPAPRPPADRDKLQGRWRLIGGESRGEVLTEGEARKENEVFIIEGDRLTIKRDGDVSAQFSIALNPKATPARLDLTHIDGRHKDEKSHAVYFLKGDTLKVCTAWKFRPNRPEERPKAFTTKEEVKGAGKLLFILKREKP